MATIYNLRAANNATFRWTRDLSQFATVYDLSSATIRLQARISPFAPGPPAYEWTTGGASGGLVTLEPTTGIAVFSAPAADMAALASDLVYDCRLETPDGACVVVFQGWLRVTAGVTRVPGDATASGVSGVCDTVTVDGERGSSPVPLPLALSAAVASCTASAIAAAASAASVSPSGLFAAFSGLSAAQQFAFAQALFAAISASAPKSPGPSPALWNNGGIPVYS